MKYRQTDRSQLLIEKLPFGDTAIFNRQTRSVHSLNGGASVVFEACAATASVEQMKAALSGYLDKPADDAILWASIEQLESAGLIEPLEPPPAELIDLGRRAVLKGLGKAGSVALPLVLTMTAAEQTTYAQSAGSGSTVSTTFPLGTTSVPSATTVALPTTKPVPTTA